METLVEAMARFRSAGYDGHWFALSDGRLRCGSCDTEYDAAGVTIDDIVRFEGESDPGDESILYALSGPCGDRGLYSASYGPDATAADVEVVGRLGDRNRS